MLPLKLCGILPPPNVSSGMLRPTVEGVVDLDEIRGARVVSDAAAFGAFVFVALGAVLLVVLPLEPDPLEPVPPMLPELPPEVPALPPPEPPPDDPCAKAKLPSASSPNAVAHKVFMTCLNWLNNG